MPMELYSSEALIRDLVNAISNAEGRPINIGGNHHRDIDRLYAFQLIVEAKHAVDGTAATAEVSPAAKQAKSRTAKIKKFMADLERKEAAPKKPRARAAAKIPASPTRRIAAPARTS